MPSEEEGARRGGPKRAGRRDSHSLMKPTLRVEPLSQNISIGIYLEVLLLKLEVVHFMFEFFQ